MGQNVQHRPRVTGSVFHRIRVKELARNAHTLVIQEQARWGTAPQQFADWHADIRRGRLRIYGGLLRFIDLAVEHGTPEDVLQQIPEWIRYYIADACVERDRLRRRMRLARMSDQ